MPNDASNLIDDAELAETQKNEFVDKHEFEDAARCLHQYDVAVAALSEYVNGDSTIFPVHCLLYTSPSPRDLSTSRMPSSA